DRDADDQVAHEVHHAVVAEVVLRAEEARAPAEVELAADDALTHRAGVDAEPGAAVVEAAAAVRRYPWGYETIRARHRWGRNNRDRRRHDQGFDYTPHDVLLLLLAGARMIRP